MYAYENYQKVKEIIAERRQKAIAAADARNLEIASISETVRIIDRELRQTGLLLFKTACRGEDLAPLRKRNTELCEKRKAELLRLGYPEDYTEIKYTCPDCSDTGYVGGRACKCLRELLITENIKSSGIGRLIERQSFDNFDVERYKDDKEIYERTKQNLAVAKDFAENFGKNEVTTLLFVGKTGTGKTHISTAIAKAVIEKGFEVLYDSTQNVLAAFEYDRFKSGFVDKEPRSDKYLECDLLILDDLGTEVINQFTVSCIYNLINTRQNRGLATVISTNLSAEELARKYNDRIYSRIVGADSRILLFVGRDNRL